MPYKILAILIKNRLALNNIRGKYQYGLGKGINIIDQIYTLRQMNVGSHKYSKSTIFLFIDFKHGFNRAKRSTAQS